MASIFSRIAAGEIPSYKVAEDDRFFAFLDINPVAPGHVLVIPKQEISYIFDLDEKTYQDFWTFARKVAAAVEKAMPCQRVGIAVIGLEVPHAHIHLVPLRTEADMDFRKEKLTLPEDEMKRIAAAIAAEMK